MICRFLSLKWFQDFLDNLLNKSQIHDGFKSRRTHLFLKANRFFVQSLKLKFIA